MNLSDGWSSGELALIPEGRIEEIGDMLDGSNSLTADKFYYLMDEMKMVVYRCPKCDRIYLQEKDIFVSYLKE